MVKGFGSWIVRIDAWAFRPREVLVRADGRVRLLTVSPIAQRFVAMLMLSAALVAGIGAHAYRQALVEIEQRANDVARLQDDHRARMEELAEALTRAADRGRAEAAEAVASLMEQRNELIERMHDVEQRLASAESERERAQTTHEGLLDKLRQIETRPVARGEGAPERAASVERLRVEALAERGRLAVEDQRLALEMRAANSDLARLRAGERDAARAQDATLVELGGRTRVQIDEIVRVLRSTGLTPERVLANRGSSAGGPFAPPAANAPAADGLAPASLQLASLGADLERLRDMRTALRRLPFGPPLRDYGVMSPYGVRRDPFNGQLAMHSGLDMSAPMRTPVMATAPGRVSVASWSGEYGNLVEIQHDFGITTRYGHLTRIDVRVGQRVERQQTVGLLGSTGRSTGPHVHYEVIVDGRTVDPARYVEAIRNVRKIE
ncbi:MAG: peptidoglycan DD-metalloendopeptidase family protein [Proteobacteria bacterium]|nr:peptidoglycan DD-metalloendopeptidase family protein [Pseudomonadota bacterium]